MQVEQRPSGRSYHVTSQVRPSFSPTLWNVPTGVKPHDVWSATDAGLGSVMPATASRNPGAASSACEQRVVERPAGAAAAR